MQQQQQSENQQEAQEETSSFNSLPNEMVEQILNLLPLQDKKSARFVNSRWYNVLNRCVQFKMPFNLKTIAELRTRSYEIGELEVVLNRVDIPPTRQLRETIKGSLLTTKTLSFMADGYEYWDRFLPYQNSFDGAGVMTLIHACRNMYTLKFSFRFLEAFKMTNPLILNNVQLDNLHTLQLKLVYGGHQHAVFPLFQLTTPRLRNLEVERFGVKTRKRKGSNADRRVYLTLLEFIVRNRKTLKSLKLINTLTNITFPDSEPTVYPAEMLNKLRQLHLESLEVHHRDMGKLRGEFDTEEWQAGNRILDQLFLNSLKLDMISNDIIQKSYIVMFNCRKTLTKLDLNVKGAEEFNLKTLRQLIRLTSLTFTSDALLMVDNFLPITLKYLTWNAPLNYQWYCFNERPFLPALVKFIVGPTGPLRSGRMEAFCHLFFGISVLYANWNFRTNLQVMILRQNPRTRVAETEKVVNGLRLQLYEVALDHDDIRITIPSGATV